jgi:hypothetical protein
MAYRCIAIKKVRNTNGIGDLIKTAVIQSNVKTTSSDRPAIAPETQKVAKAIDSKSGKGVV